MVFMHPAIFSQQLYVQFAGQALEYFDELKDLAANPVTAGFIKAAGAALAEVGNKEAHALQYPQGLDVAAWVGLLNPASPSASSTVTIAAAAPDADYLNTAPVSFPLITLTQLARLLATSAAAGFASPTDVAFAGCFGHSSGILSGVVLALAKSRDEYEQLGIEMVTLAAFHGLRCQQHCPVLRLPKSCWRPDYVREKPTPMLHVGHSGIPSHKERLQKVIDDYNKNNADDPSAHLSIGLMNGAGSVVVGRPASLHWLCEKLNATLQKDESRIPFSDRTPPLVPQFLDASVPFHSPLLTGVDAKILQDAASQPALKSLSALASAKQSLRFPVYSTLDGEALMNFDLPKIIGLLTDKPLDWSATTKVLSSKPGYVLDMGPSLASAKMTSWMHTGHGAVVVSPIVRGGSNKADSSIKGVGLLQEPMQARLPGCVSWTSRYFPRLDAKGNLETKFTKLVGRPPVMIPGMTPWSHAEQVAAVERTGYHAELAGGGIPLPGHFTKEIRKLAEAIRPGDGITVNLLFLNAYLWGFQFPLVEKLSLEGEPLESITVAAGVPSASKLAEIVETSKRARLNWIAFKPGTASAITEVVELCGQFPDFQFMIQWTGGRSGGHHSFEDQFEPLLQTYASIRSQSNITLVVGGGLGDAADAFEWLSGQWSVRFGQPAMPVDAVLMGSRVLVTAESATGEMSKDLIIAAKGVGNDGWEVSMQKNGDAGGVITVQSELGEPIHVVKNRCADLWREFDQKYFSVPQDKMVEALKRDKKTVIEKLNSDFQKPWFGVKDGQPCDIGEMTYEQVCKRLIALMFIAERGEWIDVSYRVRLQEMLTRTEERFASATVEVPSQVNVEQLDVKPLEVVDSIFKSYPQGRDARLLIEDQDYFISICNRVDRKPCNFIPQIDALFKRYFKSDSLWFSEALHAVPEGDAERTFIIYGPVAARHVRTKDEKLADLLNGVCDGLKERVKAAPVPQEVPVDPTLLSSLAEENGIDVEVVTGSDAAVLLKIGELGCTQEVLKTLLTQCDFSASLAAKTLLPGKSEGWIQALFHGLVVRGDKRAASPITRLLQPQSGTCVALCKGGALLKVTCLETKELLFQVDYAPEGSEGGGRITVRLAHGHTAKGKVPVDLLYEYKPTTPSCPLHEPTGMRYRASTHFYATIWEDPQGPAGALKKAASSRPASSGTVLKLASMGKAALSGASTFQAEFRLTRERLVDYCHSVGLEFPCYLESARPRLPVDLAIVAGWTGLISAVLGDENVGNVNWLELLHLENRFTELEVCHFEGPEDVFASSFEVIEVNTVPTGKRVGVQGIVKHCGKSWVMVTTYFFIPVEVCSQSEAEKPLSLQLANKQYMLQCDEDMVEVLKSKDFFKFSAPIPAPCELVVEIHSRDETQGKQLSVHATGTVSKRTAGENIPIGTVEYGPKDVEGNALLAFLARHATEFPSYQPLASPYLVLEKPDVTRAPVCMKHYAQASGDRNPIHTNNTFAQFAGLSGPIVHGMWLSANARRVVAEHLGEQDQRSVTEFKTEFVDTVPLGSHVVTQLKHVGMREGQLVVDVECRKLEDGRVCLKGVADVKLGKTLLTFTGQGSQFAGMGKDLRESSDVVAALWDQAEKHFLGKYGVSLLRIVDENPAEVVVYFSGGNGAKLRENYRSLQHRQPDGTKVPLFPSVTPQAELYKFTHEKGLLHATQFTQPLIVMTELAQFTFMQQKGVVPPDALFAGHSLGEYAALLSVANLLPLESLLDIVFMRGLTMQAAVKRHEDGSSDFAMCAVNPTRVGKKFSAKELERTVALIDTPEELLQIVNYNVEPLQYVCAGHVRALAILRAVLDEVATSGATVEAALEKHRASAKFSTVDALRGKATIPLKGIDVPFHSRQLLQGIPAFREVLRSYVPEKLEVAAAFEKRYIPNLLAKPFSASKDYVQLVFDKTSSPVLKETLANWEKEGSDSRRLARTLLIELLSYQFASPVLWAQTTEEVVCKQKATRFVEFGPSAILKGMLKNAVAMTPALMGKGPFESYHFGDTSDLTFTFEDRGGSAEDWIAQNRAPDSSASEPDEPQDAGAAPQAAGAAPAPQAAAPLVSAPALPAGKVAAGPDIDAAPRALDALRLIIGSRVGDVPTGKTLKQLVGGKSALQNELVGEIAQEFGSDPPDGAAEMPLEELAKHWQGYSKLGKSTSQLVSRVLLQRMPAGASINSTKKSLEEEFAMTAQTSEAVLLRSVALAPSKRLSAGEAVAWRQSLVSAFNTETGQEVLPRGSGAGAGGAAGGAVVTAAMDPKMAEKLKKFARDISTAANDFLGPVAAKPAAEEVAQPNLDNEFGSKFVDGAQPMFFKEQVREYNDWWAIGTRRVRSSWQKFEDGAMELESEAGQQALRFAAMASSQRVVKLAAWLRSQSKVGGEGEKFCETLLQRIGRKPTFFQAGGTTKPAVHVDENNGNIVYRDVPRDASMSDYVTSLGAHRHVTIRTRAMSPEEGDGGPGHVGKMFANQKAFETYLGALQDIAQNGICFQGKVCLMTGLSPGSLMEPVSKALLQGGATVIATMWWLKGDAPYEYFQKIYADYCGEGARLIVIPFNKACVVDVNGIIAYIYNTLSLDIDYFFPFAALPEKGRGIDNIDDFSELSHRVMLTNTIRMTGEIFKKKKEAKAKGKITQVVMPMSPNHGVFGFDGLYAESKLGLESFFEKWHSENLKEHIAIVGATMGWVRGTNLMMANNIVSEAMEETGCHTFTAAEMAFNLVGLLHPDVCRVSEMTPLHAVLTGKMETIYDLAGITGRTRAMLNKKSATVKRVKADASLDAMVEKAGTVAQAEKRKKEALVQPRPFTLYPARRTGSKLPSAERRANLVRLRGMVDPSSTVCITGFGEVNPWGDAWTRWEMERDGEFSIEGCVLMAWMLGYIMYHNGPQPGVKGPPVHYSGWLDVASGEVVSYWDVKKRYEEKILSNCGMRIIDPATMDGFNGSNTMMHHTVLLEEDLPPVEVDDMDVAKEFARMHGDKCQVAETASGAVTVRMLKGARIFVPRALRSDRWICSQIPSGWDPKRFGIPDDLIAQVDRVTLFALVSTAQALRESGIVDPYEFYEYVHLSQVGNTIGSGMGGMLSLNEMFVSRYHSDAKRVQGDVLQETFINTTAAWVNMLMLSASGPVKTPVGACATAIESAANAYETILSGQAKIVMVGAVDDISEVSVREFASMQATASADADKARGRKARQLSRPMSSTRTGFVESHGGGVMIFMSGDLALKMGAPIYAVVGLVHTAMDHVGRSVPAPGKGILSIVSEEASAPSPLLSLEKRRELMAEELKTQAATAERVGLPAADRARLEDLVRRRWSVDWWQGHPAVSAMRGALSVFDLTPDDITLASCHGTSTKLNDVNESDILQQEMNLLGRTPGNPLYVVTQKWLTGHPKGPAASWQMNGVMQAMMESVVPGNRNLDCVDSALQVYDHIFYTNETIHGQRINAAVVNSFGFGQAGGQCLLIHPDYFLSTVEDAAYERYEQLHTERVARAFKHRQDIFGGRAPFVPIKNEDPHGAPLVSVILKKSMRLEKSLSVKGGESEAPQALATTTTPVPSASESDAQLALSKALAQASAAGGSLVAMAIDAESVRPFAASFLERNFTKAERAAMASADEGTAAGMWTAKEAVVKALGNAGAKLGEAHAPLIDIEVMQSTSATGGMQVQLAGAARSAMEKVGAKAVQVAVTRTPAVAYAAAVLMK